MLAENERIGEKRGFYTRRSDRKYSYRITSDPPSFFDSCVSFLAKNEGDAVQISSESLKMALLVRSQYCLVDCSEKSGKKAIPSELYTKNLQKYSEGSKFTDFCMGYI